MSRFAPQRSQEMADLAHALRNGQTNQQRNQALVDKAILAGVTGALTVGGGMFQANESKKLQDAQASKAQMSGAIDSQTKERNRLLQAPGDYQPHDDGSTEGPEWLRTGKVQHGKDWFPEEPRDQGPVDLGLATDQHKQNQETNMAAAGATIGGYRTPQALDDHDQESDTLAADMNTGKNMMKMGGMMGSLPRKY